MSYSIVSTSPVASLSGGQITLTGIEGAVTVKASQAGDGVYDAAPAVFQTFVVGLASKRFVQISCGLEHTIGIRQDGTLWGWGGNYHYQVGDGSPNATTTPAQIGTGIWTQVACGSNHSLAIKSDGSLWGWGLNSSGQLGDGSQVTPYLPKRIGTANDWAKVACGDNFSLGIKTNGTLWSWGWNDFGQLGGPTYTSTPMQVGTQTWLKVACGKYHSMGIRSDGTLWTWGRNFYGELGVGTFVDSSVPLQVGTLSDWTAISCGNEHSLAIRANGSLWSWGKNDQGQLGEGAIIMRRENPTQVGTALDWQSMEGGDSFTLAVKTDGTLWSWGKNHVGQLGDYTLVQRISPVQIGTETQWTAVSAGSNHSCALMSDGTFWAWGLEQWGQLGYPLEYAIPKQLEPAPFEQVWSQISASVNDNSGSHSAGIRNDGTLWTWGNNYNGQLGDGSRTTRSPPVQVGTSSNWIQVVCANNRTAGIKSDGSLWIWGKIDYYTNWLTPVLQTGSWSTVTALLDTFVGIKTDGTLWDIGMGYQAQLGTANNWSKVSCGYTHSLAIKTDGTLWAWGSNSYGELGDGTLVSRALPVQIGSSNQWSKISAGQGNKSLALKTDGTLWSWGWGWGERQSVPVRVGFDSDWESLSEGSWMLKSNGSLWSMEGSVGNGVVKQAPMRIGSDSDWLAVSSGSHLLALKNDGKLWGLGYSSPIYSNLGFSPTWRPLRVWPERSVQTLSQSPISITQSVGQAATLDATATSGLPVTYQVRGPATLNGNQFTPYLAGGITVTSVQYGDTSWRSVNLAPSLVNQPPLVTLENPPRVSNASAIVQGSVHAGGSFTTAQFEYGTTTTYGNTAPVSLTPANGATRLLVTTSISGLAPSTLYHYRLTASNMHGSFSTSDGTFTTLASPSISMELAPSTVLTDGVSQISFGNAFLAGDGNSLSIILRNNGSGPLEGLSALIDGPHAGDFQVNMANFPYSLASGENAQFSITFQPQQSGTRSAALHILSNDGPRSPFDITLSGTAAPSPGPQQTLSFPSLEHPTDITMPVNIRAQASSGLPVILTIVSGAEVATLSGNQLTLTGVPGSVTVKASQPGDGGYQPATEVYRTLQVLPAAERFISLAGGGRHSAAIRSDGTLWLWGSNNNGQLGDGTTTPRLRPAQMGMDTNWSMVCCGDSHTIALKTDGSLWSWGGNIYGQLGDGTTTQRLSPVQIPGVWSNVSSSYNHVLAIKPGGTLWAWGSNSFQQLGDFSGTNQSSPVQIMANYGYTWSKISAGNIWSMAITWSGGLMGWGGNSSTVQSYISAAVSEVACGRYHTTALLMDGRLWAWGNDSNGQLGNGTGQSTSGYVAPKFRWLSLASGGDHTMAIRTDGTIWAWGANANGQVGDDNNVDAHSPVQLTGLRATTLAGGLNHSMALRPDGSIWSWGSNDDGQLGLGYIAHQRSLPTILGGATPTSWLSIDHGYSHSAGIQADGTLWTWGSNEYNQLGNGNNTPRRLPTQIGIASDWKQVATGYYHCAAIKSDGSLWSWGRNSSGQLGLGTTSTVPSRLGSATDWTSVDCGAYFTIARKTDGTLWAWGDNTYGQLGDGTTVQRNTPVRSGTSTWASFSCGGAYVIAIHSDGSLWSWGYNQSGKIGVAQDWAFVSTGITHSAAIKTDGSLWTWGRNRNGELGDGTLVDRSTPVRVGTANNWRNVSCGESHTAATQANDTLWCWGRNQYGQLGDGSSVDRSTPVQIGADIAWTSIMCSKYQTTASRTDRTLWVMGAAHPFSQYLGLGATWRPARSWPGGTSQSLSFNCPASIAVGTSLTLSAGATSGLPVSLAYSANASMQESTITANSPGLIHLTAYQQGDNHWSNATAVSRSIIVSTPLTLFQNSSSLSGLSGNDALPTATPHGDGTPNLLKYAFHMNLGAPDSETMSPGGNRGLPHITASPASGSTGIFRFEFLRRRFSGLIYSPEKNADVSNPATWTPLTNSPVIQPIDQAWERVIYEEPYDLFVTPRCFGRVKVLLTP